MPTKRKAKRVRAWLVLENGEPWMSNFVPDLHRKEDLPKACGIIQNVPCTITYTPPWPAARRKGKS